MDAAEKAIAMNLPNLYLLRCDAQYLAKIHSGGDHHTAVSKLFLPFPKKSYAAHRLTHRNFLQIYKKLLAPGAEIHQKTDNRKFFEFSIEEFFRVRLHP